MNKKNVAVVLVLLLGAIVVLVGIIIGLAQSRAEPAAEATGLELETNVTIGILPGVDLAQRQKELQTQLDDSQIAFSVNTNPVFDTGKSEGNLLLENPANNAKLLTAEIVLTETGEVVYQSKALVPGSYLEKIRLEKNLPKGSYPATVYLKAYREDTQKLIGQTGAAITLAVLK